MRNRILGMVGVVWGGFIVFGRHNEEAMRPRGDAAYELGRIIGLWIGILLLVSGVYYLIVGNEPIGSVWARITTGKKKKTKKKKKAIRTPAAPPDL